ncbi:MAG TPA: hypothetical protein VG452_06835, partial [Egibacteraceae bacterium]|nr:hypothetical protein [Egibacteraceae bacterium]
MADAQEQPLFSEHNVLAAYTSMEAARKAIGALEHRGVDAAHLSLLGPQAEEAKKHRGTERDEAILDKASKTAAGG